MLPVGLVVFVTRVPKRAPLAGPVHEVFESAYRREVEWWDATFMFRRLVLVVVTTLLPPGTFRLQKALTGVFFLVCLVVHLQCRSERKLVGFLVVLPFAFLVAHFGELSGDTPWSHVSFCLSACAAWQVFVRLQMDNEPIDLALVSH
uniref:Uncharacterized protein n=1 Tax=Chromera velia CCMP2878 TaxID=1169474 RepID=A0A0K6SAG5_9ALVE|eukprot:Cvel_10567.t1-p1 / transcript=Cvel_10567.t1 / gene=Cvel_10567 / organism=Chromera_velia_CCMP2878 / gene_product=hypothetical protein / transcript_product=hypothetical protein / location=Cvel_scaffold640:15324-17877(-) / protein_length=146 / sequence_SO=supercontig / SO=protein_coding / is_pseudo=false